MRDRAALVAHYHAEARRLLHVPDMEKDDVAVPPGPAPDAGVEAARRALAAVERRGAEAVSAARQTLNEAAALDGLVLRLQTVLLGDGE
jgi:hypothetical protein